MEYDGLVVRYPVDRPITPEEERRRVEVRVRIDRPPQDERRVIRANGSFLELVDKYYAWRGFASLYTTPLAAMFLFGLVSGVLSLVHDWPGLRDDQMAGVVFFCLVLALMGVPFVLLLFWLMGKEYFTLTHYPVRFNRRNRMVYVWRPRRHGGILTAKWDEVYWHLRHNRNKFISHDWFVAGHIMDRDRKTVRETFAFGHVDSRPEVLYAHWEYVRRYMEEGPDAVPAAELHLPVAARREGFWWGAAMLLTIAPGSPVAGLLLSPLLAPAVFVRWVCMLTSRVPAWPDDIEAACAADPASERTARQPARPAHGLLAAILCVGLAIDVAGAWWLLGLLGKVSA